MNKKLLLGAAVAVLALTGCSKPLAIEGRSVHLAGQHQVMVDGEWKANEWGCQAWNEMTATTIAEVKKIDAEVANKLKERGIKSLYVGEVQVGVAAAGWNTKVIANGEVKEIDGSYCVKGIIGEWIEEDQTYIAETWLPSPESGKAESLTPDTFFVTPNHTETADENGFDHNSNSAVLGEAGVYTIIIAQYTSVTANGEVLGMAAVKKA